MIEGRKAAPAELGDVVVLGLGISGKAVTRSLIDHLGSRVRTLTVYAGASRPDSLTFGEECRASGARVVFDSEDVQGRFDLAIASPGISQLATFYTNAAKCSAEVVSEVEFAWRESASHSRWVAITGTNGKTTTTSLAAHVLKACGFAANAVGNIGDTCISAVEAGATDAYVAEVSSYQLASTRLFAPDVAVLLNITPDHLAWHGSFEAYSEAKGKVFANLSSVPSSCAIVDATGEICRTYVRALRESGHCAVVPLGTSEGIGGDMRAACGSANAAFLRDDGMLVVALDGIEHELLRADELLIEGPHNVSNALAASACALRLGASVDGVREGLRSFAPLEHRLEPCGAVDGVECYNDSKATNVDSVLVALRALASRRPIVLLGGDDKGTDLEELAKQVGSSCSHAVCFGAAGPRFAHALESASVPCERAENMEQAFDAALRSARPGDTILLSPACASFDEFDNFEQRGRVFKQLVKKRQG
ncbi:MAG: UDP-N-acetylmuramoyl-L-alanine--D-glutamate ligase [Eggerthellaceae bacterium]|nr:UDP-N-acetylmuramoyl-L-alanine--D-glutamate ligase [Eggerthellaceae bacterium]